MHPLKPPFAFASADHVAKPALQKGGVSVSGRKEARNETFKSFKSCKSFKRFNQRVGTVYRNTTIQQYNKNTLCAIETLLFKKSSKKNKTSVEVSRNNEALQRRYGTLEHTHESDIIRRRPDPGHSFHPCDLFESAATSHPHEELVAD